jgi:hypothetical protein
MVLSLTLNHAFPQTSLGSDNTERRLTMTGKEVVLSHTTQAIDCNIKEMKLPIKDCLHGENMDPRSPEAIKLNYS